MLHRSIRTLLLSLMFVLPCAPAAEAIVWRTKPPPLVAMVALARLAFRGEVVAVHPHAATLSSGKQLPFTEVEFLVEEAYRGCRVGDRVSIRQLGGPLPAQPDLRLVVSEIPTYRVGEHHTVMADDTVHALTGTSWGASSRLRLVRTEAGKWRVLDEQRHPLVVRADGALVADRRWRCSLDAEDRGRCAIWQAPDGAAVDPAKTVEQLSGWLTESDLDLVIAKALAGAKAPSPAQTVSASDALFAKLLRSLFDSSSDDEDGGDEDSGEGDGASKHGGKEKES